MKSFKNERAFEREVRRFLSLNPAIELIPKIENKEAWPDILFTINGKACAYELKMPGKKPTKKQKLKMKILKDKLWTVNTFYPDDLEYLKDLNESGCRYG